ncbi:AEC family transporter [Anaerotignum sp.]|uniref:AEC family transporter n=1 Tax=Anaerotignum sp. TaxID=2039241 RepID=UPI00373656B4
MYGQFFILFAMILVGYYGYQKGWLTREVNKGLGSLVMQATIPAMLVTTIANIEITNDILLGFFLMMAAQAAAMMIFGFLMRLYGKARKLDGRLLDMLDITTGSLNNGVTGAADSPKGDSSRNGISLPFRPSTSRGVLVSEHQSQAFRTLMPFSFSQECVFRNFPTQPQSQGLSKFSTIFSLVPGPSFGDILSSPEFNASC